jgi:Ca2+-binding RTX toxin-like protein
VAGTNTLTGVNPGSDDIHVSSGATAVLNLTSTTANLSTSTTSNSGTLLINAAPSTTSTITGSAGSDDIRGGTGAVTVQESAGNDTINGGTGGTNTVVYSNVNSTALAVSSTGTATVQKASIGTDTLNNVQRIHFADTNIALDINGNAGTTAKILGAVFGAGAVSNSAYVGIGLHALDGGMSYANLMQLALNAAGATTPTAEVNLLWTNLFGAAPTAAQAAPYVAMLDSGATTPAALATMAAELSVNTTNINLVGLQHTGIHYA